MNKLRKAAGPDVLFAASTDLHANITRQVMDNLDILTGYWEYPHVDLYNTGKRAADLGLQTLRTGVKPVLAFTKIPMILQAEASMTTEGPLKELVDYAKSLIADGTILDYSLYHMQPWLDCKEAGASSVVIAKEEASRPGCIAGFAKQLFCTPQSFAISSHIGGRGT